MVRGNQRSVTDRLFRWITALCASFPRLSGSQGAQERSDRRRGLHQVYVRVVRENRMEQSRAFLDTEVVITHWFTVILRRRLFSNSKIHPSKRRLEPTCRNRLF